MARRRSVAIRLALAVLLAVACALVACAPPEMPESAAERVPPPRLNFEEHRLWTPSRAWHGAQHRLRRIPPFPWAANGVEYRRERWQGRHVVIDLQGDESSAGPGAIDRDALRAQVAAVEATVGSPPPVMLRAPQHTAWSTVARVLSAVTSWEVGTERIQIELRQDFHLARRMDLRLLGDTPPERTAESVELTRRVGARNRWVELEAVGSRFGFPPDRDAFEDPAAWEPSLTRLFDVVWWDLQQLLTGAQGATARVTIDETAGPIELAYVVSLLDVLIDAGYRTVSFPEEGFAFGVEPAPPPARYVPQPALPRWVVVASALAVVLVFGLTLASVGRRRKET